MSVELLAGENAIIAIPLASLVSLYDAGFQDADMCYRDIDQEHVSHLMAIDVNDIPAIETVKVHLPSGNVAYTVIDGYHRWDAQEQLDAPTIKGIARNYQNEAQVIDAAFMANLKHGKAANTKNRSQYAVWLFMNDEAGKLSRSDIARKVGLNQSTVSRAISRAVKQLEQRKQEAQGDNEPGGSGSAWEVDNAQKLVTALRVFFANERSILGAFGDGTGKRDANARAKAITRYLKTLPAGKQKDAIAELCAIRETLQEFEQKYVTYAPASQPAGKKAH